MHSMGVHGCATHGVASKQDASVCLSVRLCASVPPCVCVSVSEV